jgi:hypothetical protein
MPELTEAEKRQLAAVVATTRGAPVTRAAVAAYGGPRPAPKPAGRRRKTRKTRKTRRRATRNRRR